MFFQGLKMNKVTKGSNYFYEAVFALWEFLRGGNNFLPELSISVAQLC